MTSVAAGWLSETVNLAVSPSVIEPEAGPTKATNTVLLATGSSAGMPVSLSGSSVALAALISVFSISPRVPGCS